MYNSNYFVYRNGEIKQNKFVNYVNYFISLS